MFDYILVKVADKFVVAIGGVTKGEYTAVRMYDTKEEALAFILGAR